MARQERIVAGIFVALGLVGVGISFAALGHAGIGWDATFVAAAADAARAVQPGMDLRDAYASIPNTNEFYGVLTNQLADIIHNLVGGGTQRLSPYNPETFVWLGRVNIVLALMGAGSLFAAVTAATRSVISGSLSWAILLTLPLWVGMSHMNDRDVPVAVGLTMFSSGLVLSWTGMARRRTVGAIVGTLVGLVGASIALATRAGVLLPLIALGAGSVAVFLMLAFRRRRPADALGPALVAIVSPLAAVGFCWLSDPVARIDTVRWLYDAYQYSRGSFPWTVATRTAGIDVPMNHIPWWFVPAWLLALLPVLTTVAWITGLLHGTLAVLTPRRLRTRVSGAQIAALTPFWIQGFVLPAAVFAVGAQFYDGIRHLFFMIPVLAVAATLGVLWILGGALVSRRRLILMTVTGLLVVGANLCADVRWFPYDYAFINPIAGHDKTSRQWDLDYWGTSAREAVERLRQLGISPVVVVPTGEPGRPYGAVNLFDPGSGIKEPVVLPVKPGDQFGYYWFHRFEYPLAGFDCVSLFTIERDGQILGDGGRCTVPSTGPRDS